MAISTLDKETLGELRKLIRLLEKHGLEEIEVEQKDLKLRVKRPSPQAALALPAMGAQPPAAPGAPPPGKGEAPSVDGFRVVSPFVGTFYRAASPGAEPFVSVGSQVQKGDPLCIVEAMKLMNEIEAPVSGRIEAILLENGDSVEYGQELFVIAQ